MYALVSLERLSLHVVGIEFASSADLTNTASTEALGGTCGMNGYILH